MSLDKRFVLKNRGFWLIDKQGKVSSWSSFASARTTWSMLRLFPRWANLKIFLVYLTNDDDGVTYDEVDVTPRA